eukprot:scaffold1124_cov131-Isochrysis_galbana.AAC.6
MTNGQAPRETAHHREWYRHSRLHGNGGGYQLSGHICALPLCPHTPVSCGAAKYRPITVTDVQSDGRPRAVPRDPRGALPIRDAVAAVRPPCSVLIISTPATKEPRSEKTIRGRSIRYVCPFRRICALHHLGASVRARAHSTYHISPLITPAHPVVQVRDVRYLCPNYTRSTTLTTLSIAFERYPGLFGGSRSKLARCAPHTQTITRPRCTIRERTPMPRGRDRGVSTYYTLADGAPLPDGGRSHALRGRDVIHYVDNFGALACLVKGDSRDPDIGRLAHVLSAILVSTRARPWMDYVRSAANIADLPSRFDIEGLWALIPPSRHYGFKPLRFWDPIYWVLVCVSHA